MSRKTDPCHGCDCLNEYGYCTLPHYDKWYACPIEAEKPENKRMFEAWMTEMTKERRVKNESCD